MFKKEAKAYAERTKTEKELKVLNIVRDWGIESLDPDERRLFAGIQDREKAREQGFREGAEFGYNQAFVEADKNLKAIFTDLSKANEWHRVPDKLPEMDVLVYLWKKGKDFPVVARRHLPYGQKEWVWDCMWGSGFTISQLKGRDYSWKEIVSPKEIKEND